MKWLMILASFLFLGMAQTSWALDPVAPRAERKFGMIYVETPNPEDTITVTSLRNEDEKQTISPKTDAKIRVGDYKVSVAIKGGYLYEQDVIVRSTERHEVIVPGYGNVRVNGNCSGVDILQGNDKVVEIKCNEIRTLPRGHYDLKIKVGKYTLDQEVDVVTNTLRQVDIK